MKKFYKNPLVLLTLGLLVIGASTVGATRAAMISQSEADRVNFKTATFDVEITGDVDKGQIQFKEIDEDESIKIGKLYKENISVKNTSGGNYDEYIRVVVRKSWKSESEDGEYRKNLSLTPALIEIEVEPGWYINDDESTDEQTVYYRLTPVAQNEEVPFISGIRVNDKVIREVQHGGTSTTITNEYSYNGACMDISIQADAVQTNSGRDAISAAWGIKDSFAGIDISTGNKSTVNFVIEDE
ncbi:hypothetical protein [Pseudobutyrivibrio xylanivorans]|uniref:Uncharacterized protein n=1 Tax=Pseudobutyrivibrio xylanivorans TaxID=185007 RepID=A0A1G5S497_PSEXY|nr:hypothetical protein [Pseudobutyrivibrio xylanivorans]SCZ80977.1 hypothetical protein SAMN02910350_02572 [Pseudobutyrivibrio xylanivorans]